MKLRQKIQGDLQEALKNQEESRLSILRLLWDRIIKKEKEKRLKISGKTEKENLDEESQLTDEETIDLISTLIKRGREAVSQFEQGNRDDLASKEKEEMEVLQKYLPSQLSEEEIRKMIEETIQEIGAESIKDIGKVMGKLMPKMRGKADGKMVSKIVREFLSSKEEDD